MEDVFKRRVEEWAQRAYRQGTYCFSHFLSLAELNDFHTLIPSLPPVRWTLFGGAEGCERQMLRLGDEALCGYEAAFPIACLNIAPVNPRFAESLTHRDYLGALMALGIEREVLGDIVVREREAYLFCEERMAPFIRENFTQVRRTAVICGDAGALPEGALFETKRCIVQLSSQRADTLIAHVYRLSRAEAQALFPAGKVFVSGRLCESPGYTPKPGELLSVRGYGRIKYVGVESISKKGKENTAVEVYV